MADSIIERGTEKKKQYEPPRLRRFGSVERLTMTGMGNGKEPENNAKRSQI
jgi:hypothetical protein